MSIERSQSDVVKRPLAQRRSQPILERRNVRSVAKKRVFSGYQGRTGRKIPFGEGSQNLTAEALNGRFLTMDTTITMSSLNKNGSAAVALAREHGQISVTDHGETVAFILSAEKVEGLLETMEVLADTEAMKAIRSYNAGKLPLKDVACLDD